MATVSKWNPFGVALDLTATAGTVTRTSATQYTVKINVSWETYYSGAQTNYGMSATSGGVTSTISAFNGTKRSSGSGSFTGTYSISGNGSATKTVTVTFKNFNTDNGDSATKNVTFNVTVPAWTSYVIKYNANGGSGAPSNQTKWKDQTLKLSTTKPTRTGYSFLGWSTSSTATSATYAAGGNYTANSAATLYAVWKANTYTVKYNANGGSGAPANQTKTYGVTLTLSSTKPTRTNYNFKGWGTSASATTATYAAGGTYKANAAVTLYAVWELAYVKPRITNLSVDRCMSDGILSDDGTYALVNFNWACDHTLISIAIDYKSTTETEWISGSTITSTGTNGTIEQIIGNGTLNADHTYDIRVIVTDATDSTTKPTLLPGVNYVIDILKGGKGIAFNKPAELEGVADMNYQLRTLAGILQPVLETGTDFDTLFTPNTYTLKNVTAGQYVNSPITSGTGTLEVKSGGGEGQVHQIVTVCSKTNPVKYERHYYSSAWGEWIITWWNGNKVLWGGDMTSGMYMTDGHTANLTEAVSDQRHGIVLVFCAYNSADDTNYGWQSFFVPKWLVSASTSGHTFVLARGKFTYTGTKYLYIKDTTITGHADNNLTGSNNGITYANNKFVLRYVLGV